MIELDYAALRATPVATDPFPHVVVPDFVPPDSLRAVVADLPPLGKRGSFPLDALASRPDAQGADGRNWRAAAARRRSPSGSGWTSTMRRPW